MPNKLSLTSSRWRHLASPATTTHQQILASPMLSYNRCDRTDNWSRLELHCVEDVGINFIITLSSFRVTSPWSLWMLNKFVGYFTLEFPFLLSVYAYNLFKMHCSINSTNSAHILHQTCRKNSDKKPCYRRQTVPRRTSVWKSCKHFLHDCRNKLYNKSTTGRNNEVRALRSTDV